MGSHRHQTQPPALVARHRARRHGTPPETRSLARVDSPPRVTGRGGGWARWTMLVVACWDGESADRGGAAWSRERGLPTPRIRVRCKTRAHVSRILSIGQAVRLTGCSGCLHRRRVRTRSCFVSSRALERSRSVASPLHQLTVAYVMTRSDHTSGNTAAMCSRPPAGSKPGSASTGDGGR